MKEGDIVLVETFAGVDVHVKLKEYCSYSSYAGWSAELVYDHDANSLQERGCPIKIGDNTWVYDWQIINNSRHLDKAISGHEAEYEEEIELYRTYGGE